MKNYRYILKSLLARVCVIGLLAGFLSSCTKDYNTPVVAPPVAFVAFTQASPDQPVLNLYLNNNLVNFSPISYSQNLDYFQAYAGKRTVSFKNVGTANTILSDTMTFNQGAIYSLFLANAISHPELVVLKDTLARPAAGFAAIRFINLSPDAPAASLAIHGGAVLTGSKSYKGYTSFLPITGNAGYSFEVHQGTGATVLATLSPVTLNAGFLYTIWFHGLNNGTSNADGLAVDITTNAYFY
jgi:hypothetical protein